MRIRKIKSKKGVIVDFHFEKQVIEVEEGITLEEIKALFRVPISISGDDVVIKMGQD